MGGPDDRNRRLEGIALGLRVLHVTPWYPNTPTDGRYNFIRHSVEALAAAGHQVSVLVTRAWVPRVLASASAEWAHAYGPLQVSQFDPAIPIDVLRYPSIPRYILSEHADRLYRVGVGSPGTELEFAL